MVFKKLKEIICEEFDLDENDVELDSHLMMDLGLDEIDLVDLCMSIEDLFELEVTDEAAESFKTVADIVKYIEENN